MDILQLNSLLSCDICKKIIRMINFNKLTRVNTYRTYEFRNDKLSVMIRQAISKYIPKESYICPEWCISIYTSDEYINWHADGVNSYNGDKSCLTLLVYLNDDFESGETVFKGDDYGESIIKPICGCGLLFKQDILHKSNKVGRGVKYVLQSNIMVGSR